MFKKCKMEIKDLQKRKVEIVDAIDKKLSVKHNKETIFRHLVEEIGDAIILITKLAYIYNIDIEQAVLNKIEVLKKRHNLK